MIWHPEQKLIRCLFSLAGETVRTASEQVLAVILQKRLSLSSALLLLCSDPLHSHLCIISPLSRYCKLCVLIKALLVVLNTLMHGRSFTEQIFVKFLWCAGSVLGIENKAGNKMGLHCSL